MREKYFCEDKDTSSYVFYNDLHRPFVGVVERKDHRRFQLEEITPELENIYFICCILPMSFRLGLFQSDIFQRIVANIILK